jgi:transcriptional regulator with XRE-family HTH domain
MEDKITEIAERIRFLRTLIGRTPEDMAKATGESVETYLSYENGQQDFPFGFLYHCAETLGVDIVEILTGENPHLTGYNLVRKGGGLPITRKRGFDYFHLAARFKNKLAEPFLVRAPYREAEQSQPITLSAHAGQEFNYVVSGRLRFVFEGHLEELESGDSVYYDSGRKHGMIATGGEDCTFLAIVIKEPGEEKRA